MTATSGNGANVNNHDALKRAHPDFKGNWEHLARLIRVKEEARGSDGRRKAYADWMEFNTAKNDWTNDRWDRRMKVAMKVTHRGVDLAGGNFEFWQLGPVDLRGANLEGACLQNATFTKADFSQANLRGANLCHAFLRGANFAGAQLQGARLDDAILADANLLGAQFDSKASLSNADLQGANLSQAVLAGADMQGANLQLAQLVATDLRGANLRRCMVFGIAAWDPIVDEATSQDGLLVTPAEAPKHINPNKARRHSELVVPAGLAELRTDSLEHAHLIYLMSNPDLYRLLTSVNKLGVLLLGRFEGERGQVLDALRGALRARGYLPLKFDFRRPDQRTLKETILTLAGLCKFIVADLTEAKSIPLELGTIVRDYKIPVVPIQQAGRETFSMYESIDNEFRDRVLPPLEYQGIDDLLLVLEQAVVQPALAAARVLEGEKQLVRKPRKTSDYR